MRDEPYTEEELEEMQYDKEKTREYFTTVATKMFTRANNMPAGRPKLNLMRTSLLIFKYIEDFVDSSCKERE
jgi:hypothetical protein